MRARWRVLAVEVADQHQDEIIYRIKVRAPEQEKSEPTYVFYLSQHRGLEVPYSVGSELEMDERLLCVEQER